MRPILLLALSAVALAADPAWRHPLLKRQNSCPTGTEECGTIDCYDPSSEVCCAADSVHCPDTSYCTTGDDGQPACCRRGKICTGDGGINTTFGDGDSSTTSSSRSRTVTATTTADDEETTTTTRTTSRAAQTTSDSDSDSDPTTTTSSRRSSPSPTTTGGNGAMGLLVEAPLYAAAGLVGVQLAL